MLWVTSTGLLPAAVVINEIHSTPDVDQERVEFVELFNDDTQTVNVAGWRLAGGTEFVLPPGTSIAPGQFLVLAQDPAALRQKYGFASALGPWTGRLSGRGERVRLLDAAGAEVDSVNYELGFPWPTVGDAPGNSRELIHPSLDNTLGGHWRSSTAAATVAAFSLAAHADFGVALPAPTDIRCLQRRLRCCRR